MHKGNSTMNKFLEIAIIAAIEGGKEIMKVYGSKFGVEYKADSSPLTLADKNANEVINSHLEATGIPIISEENKAIDYEVRKHWETCWIVDPLDGTKEFVKRNGEFTVNIALVHKGKTELGVIYVPVERQLYFGDVQEGKSYKIRLAGMVPDIKDLITKAVAISPSELLKENIRVVGSRSHMNAETQQYVESLKGNYEKVEIVSKGSSLKFCLVAEGNADVYPRYAPTMEWDTAAGQAICEAVGLKVISAETNRTLTYNKENLLNPGFLVSKE